MFIGCLLCYHFTSTMDDEILLFDSDDDDDMLLQYAFFGSTLYFQEDVMDDRGTAAKVHRRVIQSTWWEQIDSEEHDASGEFYRTFRMNRNRFNMLANFIQSDWEATFGRRSYTLLVTRDPNAIRRKFVILWHVRSIEAGVRVTAQQFGISITNVWETVKQVCRIILKNKKRFIYKRKDYDKVSREFEEIAGVPGVYAAVD